MIKVLHWINLTRLYRCHLTFENTDEVTHYYVTDKKRHNLIRKPNVFTGSVRSIGFLNKMLDTIKPDVVITANLIDAKLMTTMKNGCKHFIYISHTIWTDSSIEAKIRNKKTERADKKYSVFDKMYFLEKENNMWRELGMPEDKLRTVHGLTYMDLLFTTEHEKNRDKFLTTFVKYKKPEELTNLKSILFLHNNTATGCLNSRGQAKNIGINSREYGKMLEAIVKYAEDNDCHVFTKIGRKSSTLKADDLIRSLHKHKRVTVILPEKDYMLADFLFCDAVINQSYSAAYQESLISNPRTACCYLDNAKEIVDSSKYPDLPVIRNIPEISTVLDSFLKEKEKYYLDTYQRQVDKLITDSFGNKMENVTRVVMDDIKELFKDKLDINKTTESLNEKDPK